MQSTRSRSRSRVANGSAPYKRLIVCNDGRFCPFCSKLRKISSCSETSHSQTQKAHLVTATSDIPDVSLTRKLAGTWLNSDNGLLNGQLEVPSNVTRISHAIKPVSWNGVTQVVYYHFGVGGGGSIYDKIIGGERCSHSEISSVKEPSSLVADAAALMRASTSTP